MPTFSQAFAAMLLAAASAHAADVQVKVLNVGSAAGVVRAQVCRDIEWLKRGCALTGLSPAQPGVTVVTVHDVPPGTWAVVAFHDKKNDGQVDRTMLGIPVEGVGFSRNPALGLRGPNFASSSLETGEEEITVDVHLHFE